ncbi:MAG: hypothetical protein U1F49_13430 [Rubrivivax sp.]
MSVALFRIDWKDIQLTATDPTSANTWLHQRRQGALAGSNSTGWRPAQGLRLAGSMSFQKAKLTEDVAAVGGKSSDDDDFALHAEILRRPFGRLFLRARPRPAVAGQQRTACRQARRSRSTASRPTLSCHRQIPRRRCRRTNADLRTAYSWDRWTASLFVKNALNKRAPINYTGNTS